MSERRSSKNALRLAQCAHEVLEKHGRNPELAIDDFVSIVRAESEALMNEITPGLAQARARDDGSRDHHSAPGAMRAPP